MEILTQWLAGNDSSVYSLALTSIGWVSHSSFKRRDKLLSAIAPVLNELDALSKLASDMSKKWTAFTVKPQTEVKQHRVDLSL